MRCECHSQLEVADGLQRLVHLQLEIAQLSNGGKERVRLDADLLVETDFHEVQVTGKLYVRCRVK